MHFRERADVLMPDKFSLVFLIYVISGIFSSIQTLSLMPAPSQNEQNAS
jgi:hypothetical protein